MPPKPEEVKEWIASIDAQILVDQLTPREIEVLGLLVQGSTSDMMAVRLAVSPHTVRKHVENLFGKLGVHSRLEAAAFAVRHGVIDVRG